MIRSVIIAWLSCSSSVFICGVSHRLCPCSPVCISTDRLFVHLELSAPTEYKRTHQKNTLGLFFQLEVGVFFSTKLGWSAQCKSVWTEERILPQHFKYPRNRSLQERDAVNTEGILYLEPATRGWTHFCSIMWARTRYTTADCVVEMKWNFKSRKSLS